MKFFKYSLSLAILSVSVIFLLRYLFELLVIDPALPLPQFPFIGTIKVVSVAYYPLREGRLDTTTVIKDTYGEYQYTLEQVQQKVDTLQAGTIDTLTEGSGHISFNQKPTLAYEVVGEHEFLEPVPLTTDTYNELPLPDYRSMMEKIDVCHYVDELGVREVWLWTYAGTGKAGWMSNFSSPQGDISTSNRDPSDLPICQHNYTVYDYNYGRGVSEAVYDHLAQYEMIFRHTQGTTYKDFTDPDQDQEVVGCGTAWRPPNTDKDFNYSSTNQVTSNCDYWDEAEPKSHPLDCHTWGCDSLSYYIWWMRHIPSQWWTHVVNPDLIFSTAPTPTSP